MPATGVLKQNPRFLTRQLSLPKRDERKFSDGRLDRFSHHDVQLDGLGGTNEVDLFGNFEAEFSVDFGVDAVAAFQVTVAVLRVGLGRIRQLMVPFWV